MRDFAAIDFETANECPSSVCSVGIVVVRGGEIVDRFYSLIHPEPEYYQWFCRQVHGLGPEDTEEAPVFPYVWEKIEPLIEGAKSLYNFTCGRTHLGPETADIIIEYLRECRPDILIAA